MMTPEMTERANTLLNDIAAAMKAKGRNAEVRHKVGETGKDRYGREVTFGRRQDPCLFLDDQSCEIGFQGQFDRVYGRRPLIEVSLEGVRDPKRYQSLRTTRTWKETTKEGIIKKLDAEKIAAIIVEYADLRKSTRDSYRAEMDTADNFRNQARALANNLPVGLGVSGDASGLCLSFTTTDAAKLAKVIEAIKGALA